MKFGVVLLLLVFPAAGVAVAQTSTPQSSVVGTEGIISPSRPVPVGKAPGMQAKLVEDTPQEKVYAIIFREGDEALSGLTDFAIAHGVKDAHFTAIGAAQSATLAWLDLSKKSYRKIAVGEQCEVLSLLGDVAQGEDGPIVHIHVVLGLKDGTTRGGHLLEGRVFPTLEVVVTETPAELRKVMHPDIGTALIDLDQSQA